MNIVQVNTYDIQGGAARAAYRLHKGLLLTGQESLLLSRYKVSSDSTVLQVIDENQQDDFDSLSLSTIQSHYINNNRTSLTNTLFSLPYPGFDLSHHPAVLKADVINLHWVAAFQSPITLKKLFDLDKPVVWTLHDMWAFTGGCHYSAGCDKYQQECVDCPQLADDPYHLAKVILEDKLNLFANANLTLVTPSQWLAECVSQSKLFQGNRVEVIPYSLEIEDVFVPIAKPKAKQIFGINPQTITLLFGAGTATEERKGFAHLVEAIQHCLKSSQFQTLVAEGQIEILCFGYPSELIYSLGVPVRSLGSIDSDFRLSQAYSAADLFILPSLEDNLPNTMLEAMSCGTPVIGFDVGGIPDLVKDYTTGRLVPLKNTQQMAEAILDCIFDPELRQRMSHHCRQLLEANHSITTQAKRYLDLYQDLVDSPTNRTVVMDTTQQNSLEEELQNSSKYREEITLNTSLGQSSAEVFDQISRHALIAKSQYDEAFLKQIKTDLIEAQTKLAQTQSQLTQTEVDLEAARQGWTGNQRVLEQVQAELVQEKQLTETLRATLAGKQQVIDQLQSQLQDIEVVRSRTIHSLSSSNEHLKHRFQDLNQSLQKLKKDNQELVQSKEHLEQELAYLSTGKAAVRKLFKVMLHKLKLYNLIYNNYKLFVPIYNVLFRDKWNPATLVELSSEVPASTPQKSTAIVVPSKVSSSSEIDLESPLVQALIALRNLGVSPSEETNSDLLNWLSTLAENARNVLCIQPSHDIVPLLQFLKQQGASILCVDCPNDRSAFQAYGFEAIAQDLPQWMIRTNRSHFYDFDLIYLSPQLSSETLLLLKGRLSPETQLITHSVTVYPSVNETDDSKATS